METGCLPPGDLCSYRGIRLVALLDQSVGDQLVGATICGILRFGTKKLSASVGPLIIIYLLILFPFMFVYLLTYSLVS